ncbi:unnamed protein product [Diamesa hyperborea]
MRTMKRVFDRLGYQRVDGNKTAWDVMWIIENAYDELDYDFTKLKHYQRVNHFPGIPYLINKKYLTTNTVSKYLPPAFEFPDMIEEFKEYVENNPDKKFVEKNYDNRGVKIVNIKDVNYKNKNKFVQEFVGNPLLIDDRMFDFGVYVVIASVNPLRVYRYQGDVLARFCPEPYYPFDPKNIDKYVVYETQKNVWQMPSLSKYCKESEYSYKTAIESHLRDRNHNITYLWEQVDDAIVSIVQSKEHDIAKETSYYGPTNHFFELVRFDFIFDANLKAHVMEVNMSPNLTPAEDKYEHHAMSYEQVVYNTLKLVGLGTYSELRPSSEMESNMISSTKDITVEPMACMSAKCINSECNTSSDCDLCLKCLNNEKISDLHRAYREHMQRGEMKRLFPAENYFDEDYIAKLSKANQFHTRWIKAKCKADKTWC